MKLEANNPELTSWVNVPEGSDFPIQNLPFGVFQTEKGPHVGVAIGDQILDLAKLYKKELLGGENVFEEATLNPLIKQGKKANRILRNKISEMLRVETSSNTPRITSSVLEKVKNCLVNQADVEMLLPVKVGDYTDFYSSIDHATNVGKMFRDPANALMPNWKHIPVGYHGRSSSIIVSGQDIYRPKGQTRPDPEKPPVFGPSKLMDFELEVAFITYDGKPLGDSISTKEADEYIFGLALFNDWSARDIQKWEYVPLGPFLGKNFASSLSPWIVMLDALEPFRVPGEKQDPKVLPYLRYQGDKNIDIQLQVAIKPEGTDETVVSNSNYKYMYWNMNQQLAHHTINGCNINAGDMMASGTISGPTPGSYGSMLEISWQGTKSVKMKDGTERKFIQDNDTVIIRGHAEKDGVRVGFGEVACKLLPAKK